jgi:hypothetical protein
VIATGRKARPGDQLSQKLRNGTEILKAVEIMPETKTKQQRRRAAKKKTVARTPAAGNHRTATRSRAQHDSRNAAKRTAELSEEVLKSLDEGARSAIEAVRKFVETVDEALPPHSEGPSTREEITDSALEMAQRLVHTQYEFLRKVVDSAGKTLTGSDDDAKSK